jgi:hypothetical protein
MSAKPNELGSREPNPRLAGLFAWLAGHATGRLTAGRGRWIKMILTVALLVTGLSAWALAVVQPWAARSADPGIVALPAVDVSPEKVRMLSQEVERLCGNWKERVLRPLRRNPFGGARAAGRGGGVAAPSPGAAAPAASAAEKSRSAPEVPTAKEILSALKALRLEVTLVSPSGEHWAVIDGKDYRVGDTVGGMEIIEIGEGQVKLQRGAVTCLLRMD